jgi:hypothetical protein
VDVVLGRDDVVLRDSSGAEVMRAPTAADLHGLGDGYALDFPGNALEPGCTYEQWFQEIADGVPTTVYAHVVGEPGEPGLALQYWLYWPYNDWNNKHESDWEMIQLVFDASTPAQALGQTPVAVGFAQHEGAERSDWDDDDLRRDGDHPIVHSSAGSHSSQYADALYLGHSAQSGFGCDDTRGPATATQAEVILLPDAPSGPDDPYAWLAYEGRWGEIRPGPNSGPTGPNAKDRWLAPISYVDDWRNEAVQVPASSGFSPSTTDFFCGAVERGSELYLTFLLSPWTTAIVLAVIVLLVVLLVRRTAWRPAPIEPIEARRRSGELFGAAYHFARQRWRLLAAVGAIYLPVGIAISVVQQLLFDLTPLGDVVEVATGDRFVGALLALALGSASTIVATVIVQAAMAEAVDRAARGDEPRAGEAYAAVGAHGRALAWSTIRIVVVVALLSITIVGIPFAIVYAVRRTVTPQAVVVEDVDAVGALDRSRTLTRPRTWQVFWVAATTNLLTALVGPLLGVVVLLAWSPGLRVVNLVSSLVYAVLMPFAAIVLALLFYDLRLRATSPIQEETASV